MTDHRDSWMRQPPNTKDDWHVLIVTDPTSDDGVLWLHPETCAVTVSSRAGIDHECHTASDLRSAGRYGLFDKDDTVQRGIWLVAPWVEECRGLDWTEYDGGWTVIPLAEVPDKCSSGLSS